MNLAMADNEFQESEVIFSVDNLDFETCLDFRRHHQNDKSNFSKKKKMGKINNNDSNNNIIKSVPVKIPNNMFSGSEDDSDGDSYKEEEWDGGEMVPPHLIVRRRIAGKMAFSLCTGNGRTLKGRDLSRVRNSILRMTGFLEA